MDAKDEPRLKKLHRKLIKRRGRKIQSSMLKWANYTIACNEQKGEIFKKHVRVIKNTKKKKSLPSCM